MAMSISRMTKEDLDAINILLEGQFTGAIKKAVTQTNKTLADATIIAGKKANSIRRAISDTTKSYNELEKAGNVQGLPKESDNEVVTTQGENAISGLGPKDIKQDTKPTAASPNESGPSSTTGGGGAGSGGGGAGA